MSLQLLREGIQVCEVFVCIVSLYLIISVFTNNNVDGN